jgi:hypothetical protein
VEIIPYRCAEIESGKTAEKCQTEKYVKRTTVETYETEHHCYGEDSEKEAVPHGSVME